MIHRSCFEMLSDDCWLHVASFLSAPDAEVLRAAGASGADLLGASLGGHRDAQVSLAPFARRAFLGSCAHALSAGYRHVNGLDDAEWTAKVAVDGICDRAVLPQSAIVFQPFSLMIVAACPLLSRDSRVLSVAFAVRGQAGRSRRGEGIVFARPHVTVTPGDDTATLFESHRTSVDVYFDVDDLLPAAYRGSVSSWEVGTAAAWEQQRGVIVAHIRASEVEHAVRSGLLPPWPEPMGAAGEQGRTVVPRPPRLPAYSPAGPVRGALSAAPFAQLAIAVDIVTFEGRVRARAVGSLLHRVADGACAFRVDYSIGFVSWARRRGARLDPGCAESVEPPPGPEGGDPPGGQEGGEMLDFAVFDAGGALVHSDCGLEIWVAPGDAPGPEFAVSPFMSDSGSLSASDACVRLLAEPDGCATIVVVGGP